MTSILVKFIIIITNTPLLRGVWGCVNIKANYSFKFSDYLAIVLISYTNFC